jgi:hypothetical protein
LTTLSILLHDREKDDTIGTALIHGTSSLPLMELTVDLTFVHFQVDIRSTNHIDHTERVWFLPKFETFVDSSAYWFACLMWASQLTFLHIHDWCLFTMIEMILHVHHCEINILGCLTL